jgi:hypothetical protein
MGKIARPSCVDLSLFPVWIIHTAAVPFRVGRDMDPHSRIVYCRNQQSRFNRKMTALRVMPAAR